MKAILQSIDSEVLGGSVLAISDFSSTEDFATFEEAYVEAYQPLYVSCKVSLDHITHVHLLERRGFSLIECQIRSRINLEGLTDVSRFPYAFARVTTEEDLEPVLEIAATTFAHDRFSIDPLLKRGISGERYRRYVRQSFDSSEEAVYRLYDPVSNSTVAFKTHRYLDNHEVLLLLGGVRSDYKQSGLGVINTYAELDELRRKGITCGHTHISAANYPVFNLEIGKLGFRVVTTFAVMRKLYAHP